MGLSIQTLKLLQDAGVPAARILEVAEAIERDFAKPPRSKGAERQARWRERNPKAGVTESVTRDVSGDGTETQQVTSLSEIPLQQEKLPSVEVVVDYGLSNASAQGEREQAARDLRNRTGELLAICQKRLNGCGDFTRPAMHDVSPLIRITAPMSGKPCDWVLDVELAMDQAVAQKRADGGRVTTLEYLVPIALRNRDKRLAGNPDPEKPNGRPDHAARGAGGRVPYGSRGPAEDPIDRMRARMGGRSADADIIEHTPLLTRA